VWCEFDPVVPVPKGFTCSIQAQVMAPEPAEVDSFRFEGSIYYPTFSKRDLNLQCADDGDFHSMRVSKCNLLRSANESQTESNYLSTCLFASFSYITKN
jgi:hypothetical protein